MRRPFLQASCSVVFSALSWLLGSPPCAAGEALSPGSPVEGTLASDEERAFEVRVDAGQFARVEVTQIGLDVTLEVRGPDGAAIGVVDQARVRESVEVLGWIAPASGIHQVLVRTRRSHPGGRFRIRFEEPRAAGPREGLSLDAERSFAEAVRARSETAEGARERAVDGFVRAADSWRQAGDQRYEARALIAAGALGWVIAFEPSRERCLAGLRITHETGDAAQEADALNCLTECAYAQGAYDEGVETQLAGLEIAVANGNRFRESEGLQNLAVLHAGRLEPDDARVRYEESIALAREIGDKEVLGFGLGGLAASLNDAGEVQRAHDLLREALEVQRAAGDQVAECNSLINLSFSLQLLGEYDEAETLAHEVIRLARLTGTPLNEVYGLNRLSAIAAARGDTGGAVARAEGALAIARQKRTPREERVSLDALAYAHFKAGSYSSALQAATEALEVSRRQGNPPGPPALLNLCRLREAAGELDRAAAQCAEALAAIRSTGHQRLLPIASYLLARVARQRGDLDASLRWARDSVDQLEASRSQLRRQDWRGSFVQSYREIDDFYVDLLIESAERSGRVDRVAEAFDGAERARTRALRDVLMESRAAGSAGVDDRLLARARLLRRQVSTGLERQLRTGAVAGTDAKLAALEEELRNAESEIRRLTPRYRELNATPILGVRELQPRLDDDTVLLAFAVGDHHSALWVVTRDRLEMRALPPRETLDRLARATYESVARSREADSSSPRALARAVLDPAGALKPRVLVIADGSLHYVPFAALPDARGGRLIDRHEVTVLPSVSTVRLLQQRTGPTASRSVALLADPVFRADDERLVGAPRDKGAAAPAPALTRASERFGGLEQLARLPLTRREATRIAAVAGKGATVALDFDANLATAREGRLAGFRYVHFATHGFLNPWRPELSGLVLSLYDAEGRSRDGFLSALDAFNLDLSADVVVLSGCRTALGKEVQGEGLVGLPQAFMYAGARRVVSSLWSVDDAATAALMTRFYRELFAPTPRRPAAALRAAQEWVRAQPQWRDPYYWAAFQIQGDWN